MYITSISPSGYNTEKDCQMKYFISYLLRMREPSNKAAEKGTIIHALFEILALHKKAQQDGAEFITHEIYGFTEKDIDGEIKKEPVKISAEDPTTVDVEKVWEDCWEYYVAESIHEFTEKDKKEARKWADSVLGSDLDPRVLEIVSTEQYIKFEIKEDWAKYKYWDEKTLSEKSGYYCINTIIDLVVRNPDGSLKFIDWKSGQRKDWTTGKKKEYADLQVDIQLNIYYWLLKELYPDTDVEVCIVYLKDGGPYDLIFTQADINRTIKKLRQKFRSIRETVVPQQNKSFKCKWCHFSKTSLPDAPKEYRKGKFSEIGQPMSICDEVHQRCFKDGVHVTIQELRVPYDKK